MGFAVTSSGERSWELLEGMSQVQTTAPEWDLLELRIRRVRVYFFAFKLQLHPLDGILQHLLMSP